MKKFTPNTVKNHHLAINALIEKYAKDNGLTYKPGNVVYDTNTMNFKGITLKLDGVTSAKDISDSNRLGYSDSIIGKTFTHDGEKYKIVELKPRNKMPIIATDISSGKSYRFPASLVPKTL